jgi:hypothetical protein
MRGEQAHPACQCSVFRLHTSASTNPLTLLFEACNIMKILNARSYFALAAAVGMAACSSVSDSTSRITAPSASNLVAEAALQTATVCKAGSSPLGTYNFTATTGGSANSGDVVVPTFSLTIATPGVDACTTVFSRFTSSASAQNSFTDAAATVIVTELAAAGTTLDNITTTGPGAAPAVIDVANRKVTVSINAYHSDKATFFNKAVPVAGCTFTQGWYKNHTSLTQWGGLSKDALFYSSGLSWIDLYNTPPKGSQYIILAHQFMTTTLNITKGASVPPAVQAAYDAAKTYFTSGGTIDPSWATILDEYNNGLAAGGPAHCE